MSVKNTKSEQPIKNFQALIQWIIDERNVSLTRLAFVLDVPESEIKALLLRKGPASLTTRYALLNAYRILQL